MNITEKDIITGLNNDRYMTRRDLSEKWNRAINLGTAHTGEDLTVDGHLGGTNKKGVWDSVDRLKFGVNDTLHLELTTDPNVITELVRFENGVASVVGSVEYGNLLSLDLTPGKYGLSFFVEGDAIAYHATAHFS